MKRKFIWEKFASQIHQQSKVDLIDPHKRFLVLNCCKMLLSLSFLAWIVSLGLLVTDVRGQDGLRGLRTADEKPTNVSRSLSCFG